MLPVAALCDEKRAWICPNGRRHNEREAIRTEKARTGTWKFAMFNDEDNQLLKG